MGGCYSTSAQLKWLNIKEVSDYDQQTRRIILCHAVRADRQARLQEKGATPVEVLSCYKSRSVGLQLQYCLWAIAKFDIKTQIFTLVTRNGTTGRFSRRVIVPTLGE